MTLYASHTDEQLVASLKNSEEGAFTELYSRHYAGTYYYLLGFTKDGPLTEDLVHEVFIKLWEVRERLSIEASFSAYLYRICHNKAVNTLKKIASDQRLRDHALSHLGALQLPRLPPDTAEYRRYDQLLESALNSLPPQRRRVFELIRQEGKSYEQAASELDVSLNTVKDHMVKAMRSLRGFLAEKGEIALLLVLLEKLF
jgi:RNA polymerase sigma-70 factor (family 1)